MLPILSQHSPAVMQGVERKTKWTICLLCCVPHHSDLFCCSGRDWKHCTGNYAEFPGDTPSIYAPKVLSKTIFALGNLWSIKVHVVLHSRRAVLLTASWPNFMNIVSLSTASRIVWRCCYSFLRNLKWHGRLLWTAKQISASIHPFTVK